MKRKLIRHLEKALAPFSYGGRPQVGLYSIKYTAEGHAREKRTKSPGGNILTYLPNGGTVSNGPPRANRPEEVE